MYDCDINFKINFLWFPKSWLCLFKEDFVMSPLSVG